MNGRKLSVKYLTLQLPFGLLIGFIHAWETSTKFRKIMSLSDLRILKPRKTTGLYNQKPLTIKPYPIKFENEYNASLWIKKTRDYFFDFGQSCFYYNIEIKNLVGISRVILFLDKRILMSRICRPANCKIVH